MICNLHSEILSRTWLVRDRHGCVKILLDPGGKNIEQFQHAFAGFCLHDQADMMVEGHFPDDFFFRKSRIIGRFLPDQRDHDAGVLVFDLWQFVFFAPRDRRLDAGPFVPKVDAGTELDQLRDVRGIGEKRFAELKPLVTV